ncbi:MAG: hypothetical protein DMG67_13735 [Acidobacteria bacterium]|nr:MAG: hypothetical protein DMG67_13735 [Acidobacteriota bacterium]
MTVVADSSPLIILAKLGCFDLLNKLYPHLYISAEVHREVVIAGAGLPGASEVAKSQWIEVKHLLHPGDLPAVQQKFGLGVGELSTILLGKELKADAVLLDDYHARKLAKEENLRVRGSIGLLEAFYRRGYLSDLRGVFQQLISHNVYIDRRLLNRRLLALGITPL